MRDPVKQRPGELSLIDALTIYRYPVTAIVSILHRISGVLLFVLLPFIIWMFDASISSEASFERLRSLFVNGVGFVPAWVVKAVCLVLIWGFVYHSIAGLRYLWMDATLAVSKEQGRRSSKIVLVLSTLVSIACAAKFFHLF